VGEHVITQHPSPLLRGQVEIAANSRLRGRNFQSIQECNRGYDAPQPQEAGHFLQGRTPAPPDATRTDSPFGSLSFSPARMARALFTASSGLLSTAMARVPPG